MNNETEVSLSKYLLLKNNCLVFSFLSHGISVCTTGSVTHCIITYAVQGSKTRPLMDKFRHNKSSETPCYCVSTIDFFLLEFFSPWNVDVSVVTVDTWLAGRFSGQRKQGTIIWEVQLRSNYIFRHLTHAFQGIWHIIKTTYLVLWVASAYFHVDIFWEIF